MDRRPTPGTRSPEGDVRDAGPAGGRRRAPCSSRAAGRESRALLSSPFALAIRVHIVTSRARSRPVNPPHVTWVAFGPDARGYKKHSHFKIAVSRNCVRFLFEVGPEHADKRRWASTWKKNAPKVGPVLRRGKHLAWFKNEHDEEPTSPLSDFTPEKLGELADELTRTRVGQFVVGRAVLAEEASLCTEAQYRFAALETFRTLAPLYRLR